MWVPWFDVDTTFAEVTELSRRMDAMLGNRGLDGRHGLRTLPASGDESLTRSEGSDALTWSADLPGVRAEDVGLAVESGMLTVTARRATPVPEGWQPRYSERRAFELRRSWTLPENIDPDKIEARLADGVLTLTLPLRAAPAPRTVPVRTV